MIVNPPISTPKSIVIQWITSSHLLHNGTGAYSYNNTKLQLIYADLESSPEPNEDPVSREYPILTNDPTLMDADDDTDVEVESPTAEEIVQAGLQS